MRKSLTFSFLAIVAMFVLIACNSEATNSSSFTTKAAQGGMSEVQLGNLALAKGQSADVKLFAQQMITEHTKANNDLKEIAAKKSVALPTDTNNAQKSLMEKLSALSGAEFDKEYVKAMVEDHEKDVEEFKAQAESGTDEDIKAFAAKNLPTLQSHLDMIKGIQNRMMK